MVATSCDICAEDFSDSRLRSLVRCGHDTVCSLCTLKIRALVRDRTCPFCNTECEHTVCTTDLSKTYEDYEVYGDSIGPEHVLDARSQMFFPKTYFKTHIEALWACRCPVGKCGAVKSTPIPSGARWLNAMSALNR